MIQHILWIFQSIWIFEYLYLYIYGNILGIGTTVVSSHYLCHHGEIIFLYERERGRERKREREYEHIHIMSANDQCWEEKLMNSRDSAWWQW